MGLFYRLAIGAIDADRTSQHPSDAQVDLAIFEEAHALDALPFTTAKAQWLAERERQHLAALLAECRGNVAEASRRSGITRSYLFRLLKKYRLAPDP